MEHIIKGSLLESTVKVALVGAGGTGSQVLTGLARLHRAMLALGHPGGLHVTVFDPDLVSEANVGRQLFSDSDVGFSKAVVLVHRINLYYGLSWKAEADRAYNLHEHDIVIGCVDTRSSRRDIHRQIHNGYRQPCYWLISGTVRRTGR
jgi:PRTRC genetic system ThiF family protein